MDNEGLRIGMFLAGLLMASVPVSLGVAFGVFLYKEYKRDRAREGEGTHQPTEAS